MREVSTRNQTGRALGRLAWAPLLVLFLVMGIALVAGYVSDNFGDDDLTVVPEEAREIFLDVDGDGDRDYVLRVLYVPDRTGDPTPEPMPTPVPIPTWPPTEEPAGEVLDPTPAP